MPVHLDRNLWYHCELFAWKQHFSYNHLIVKAPEIFIVDGSLVDLQGQVKVNPILKTVARPFRIRIINTYIISCTDKSSSTGAAFPRVLLVGNSFLVHCELDMKDFINEHIERLSFLDFSDLFKEENPTNIGKWAWNWSLRIRSCLFRWSNVISSLLMTRGSDTWTLMETSLSIM